MNLKLNGVSMAVIWVQGILLCEMNDGDVAEFKLYGRPDYPNRYRYETRERIAELCAEANRQHLMDCNNALHLSKERRYGHGYASRGY